MRPIIIVIFSYLLQLATDYVFLQCHSVVKARNTDVDNDGHHNEYSSINHKEENNDVYDIKKTNQQSMDLDKKQYDDSLLWLTSWTNEYTIASSIPVSEDKYGENGRKDDTTTPIVSSSQDMEATFLALLDSNDFSI
jgi:hypothetical protein